MSKTYIKTEIVESSNLGCLANVFLDVLETVSLPEEGFQLIVTHKDVDNSNHEMVVSNEIISKADYEKHKNLLLDGMIEVRKI